jgi:hypothetical protein
MRLFLEYEYLSKPTNLEFLDASHGESNLLYVDVRSLIRPRSPHFKILNDRL